MKTKAWAIWLILGTTLLTSIAQILFKIGSNNLSLGQPLISNFHLFFGFLLYGIAALFFIITLKHGEVTIIYPIIATSYIWVIILSSIFLKESADTLKILGIFFIFIGVIVLGKGGKND